MAKNREVAKQITFRTFDGILRNRQKPYLQGRSYEIFQFRLSSKAKLKQTEILSPDWLQLKNTLTEKNKPERKSAHIIITLGNNG